MALQTSFTFEDGRCRCRVDSTLAGQQGRGQDHASLAQHMDLQIGAIEQVTQIEGTGAVMGEHQQAEQLAQGRLVRGQGIPVQALAAALPHIDGRHGSGGGNFRIEQQEPVHRGLQGIPHGPADRRLQFLQLPARGLPVQQGMELEDKTATSTFVAMHRAGEGDACIALQHAFQQGQGDSGRLVHQQQVRRRAGTQQGIGRQEFQYTTLPFQPAGALRRTGEVGTRLGEQGGHCGATRRRHQDARLAGQ